MKQHLSLQSSHRDRTWVPYFVLLVTLLLTTFATYYVARTAKAKEELRFEKAVQSTHEKIENRLDTYITLLRATSGLFAADDVSRAQFRAFVNRLRLQERYPGIQGIGYSVRVTPQEVNALVANMQTQGVKNFTIRPEFQRNEYHSIIYLEPLNRRNQAAIGFDMFTESVRRAAMERARDTGAPAASGKVTLVQEIDKQKQAGFLIYVPIYRNGAIPDTIAKRRSTLIGFAYSPFRADDLMAGILATEKQPTVNFEIYDSTVSPANLLHSSISDTQVNRASDQPRFSSTSTINIAGRTWKIAFASHPEFDRSSDENLVPYVFFCGVVVSMVLFGVTRSQSRAKDTAEQAAAELRVSEQALRQSEERYRAFIAQSSEGIWCFELEQPLSTKLSVEQQIEHFYQYGYLIECNDVMAQMYGYSYAEEIVGIRLRNLLIDTDPDNIEYLRCFIRSGYRLNAVESHEVNQHGEAKYFLNSLVGIVENGVLVRAWGTQLDITQRKQLEDALNQKSVEREVLLNSIPALVYYKDLDSNYIAVNQTFAEIINTPIDKIPGKNDFDFFPAEQAAAFRKDDIEVMELGDRKWNIEERLTDANGKTMWVATYKTPYRNQSSEITGLVGITIDITERKQIEEALRERETRYRLVARATNDAIWDWDLVTNTVEWNEGVETLFGYWATDVSSGSNWWYEHIHPDDRERIVSGIHEVIDSGGQIWTDEYRFLRADNSYALVIDRGFVAHDEQGKPVRMIGSMMDITERKKAQAERDRLFEQLEVERSHLEAVLQQMPGGVIIANPSGKLSMGNNQVEQIWRHPFLASEEINQYSEWHGFHPDGQPYQPQDWPLSRSLTTGEVVTNEEATILRGDRTYGTISLSSAPIRNAGGQIIAGVVIFFDITTRKQAEQEREQLLASEQAARTEAEAANRMKDEFLATLSHELRTPLNAMAGWTQLLRTRKFDEKTTARALETIDRNTKSLAQLIEDVLDVSRIITGKLRLNMSHVELVPIIEAAIETVQPAADAKHIQIELILQASAGSVFGDVNRLQQVFWNLLSNAVKFTPKGGCIEIKLEMIDSRMQVRVKDTGLGIAPEFLPYVFERFRQADSTTTRSYGGLGLGLAIVRHLVELHGGTVGVESAGVGLGATFIVNLPLRAVRLATSQPKQAKLIGQVSYINSLRSLEGLKVLVVDDEPDARELVTTVLEEYKAQVVAVATAGEALDVIKQLQPNVLVSDIGMPEEDGYALIRKVRALDAHQGGRIPAVALTAYARPEDRTQALLAGFQQHISKPVDPAELAAVVASLTGRN